MNHVIVFVDALVGETKANPVNAQLHLIKEIIHMFVFWLAREAKQSVVLHFKLRGTIADFKRALKLSVYVQTVNTRTISSIYLALKVKFVGCSFIKILTQLS